MEKGKQKRRAWRIVLIVLAAVLLTVTVSALIYLSIGHPALHTVEEYAAAFPDAAITVADDGGVEILPGEGIPVRETGVIFYVGAKITPDAYIPLFAQIAAQGYSCFLPKMTFNFAIFNENAAEEIMRRHGEITRWVIGGHSLGGWVASMFAEDHRDELAGLFYLASYSDRDLSGTDLSVLSVYGDEDGVLNRSNYEKRRSWNPSRFEEHVIRGGNHAQFGDYGKQFTDWDAAITEEEQRAETAAILLAWLGGLES